MKNALAVFLAAAVMLCCALSAFAEGIDPGLIARAQADGEVVVYGSCEEDYLQAACDTFELLYGIKVTYQHMGSGAMRALIEKENGHPTADVWFGGTTDPYIACAGKGLLQPYEAVNASHLLSPAFRGEGGTWYGIYRGILGFVVDAGRLAAKGLEVPRDWQDLLKNDYKDLIWTSNYNTSGTAQMFLNTMVQLYGREEAIKYLVALDRNVKVYTRSGPTPSKNVGTGDCLIAICFLHDGITQIMDNEYENIDLVIPSGGTAYEIGATAILKGARHESAAQLWIEYALSPACVEQANECGSYQFLVLDNAEQPPEADRFGLRLDHLMEYDFEDARNNTSAYVAELMEALGPAVDDRFQTN